jgi:hypothetical protein
MLEVQEQQGQQEVMERRGEILLSELPLNSPLMAVVEGEAVLYQELQQEEEAVQGCMPKEQMQQVRQQEQQEPPRELSLMLQVWELLAR